MGRYRKIEIGTWADSKFKALSKPQPNAQSLWIYLLTGPHTNSIPGVFVAGKATLSESLEWDFEVFGKVFQELLDAKMIRFDQKTRLVWIPNALKYNLPESPNVIRSWKAQIRELPESELLGDALYSIRNTIYGMGEGFQKAFVEAFGKDFPKASPKPSSKAMPNQEQEYEQEQEEFAAPENPAPDVLPVDNVENFSPATEPRDEDFNPSPTAADFTPGPMVTVPPPLKFTESELAELMTRTGDNFGRHLARLAPIREGKDYGFKNDWALLRWFWDKAGGPDEWLAGEKPEVLTGLKAQAARVITAPTPDELEKERNGIVITGTGAEFVKQARAARA